ncbi:SPO22-domain-containing protein [Karstenula rhodostoma CBS 690.94]|uniref:Protein ZIP4 homolog n=1 Tax=Karstenula rhodostoma CBS 690.94 TaxID=1392251 RepID=A0A9P4PN61_9PLEO|nr:SPO22-domain-containing protein [Karstenula rhodostoma CBS 690.94]
MAPSHPTARSEREKKVKSVCAFASTLADRLEISRDRTLAEDLQSQIRSLPLPATSAVIAKQDELENLGTELWNTSTRLRRDLPHTNARITEDASRKNHEAGLLRVFSFLLLDSAGSQAVKGRERKNCIRLMKVALKAAKWCVENKEVDNATRVLERAAEYQEILGQEGEIERGEAELGERLRVEYYALRTALAWRSDRLDTAEHMFMKCKQLSRFLTASLAESVADLLYEMCKDLLSKNDYEATTRWLERAYDIIGEQSLEMLSAEAGELKLSIMQSIVQAYMKLKTPEARTKAWHMLQLLEADHEDKMSICLLRLELLYSETKVDPEQVYLVVHRLMHFVVLNDRNFKTIMHHVHKLKDQSAATACKIVDELISTRLFREEKEAWIEKAVITRVWITCTSFVAEGTLIHLRDFFDEILRNAKAPLSAQATHAAQTLLWKQVEATSSRGQHEEAEAWCGICLHSLFNLAGEINKSKIARKIIMCALARHDYAAARDIFSKMSDPGRDDRVTRYLMYKVALHSNDPDLAAECLDAVCRQSSKDTSLLYACVIEAQQSGNKREGIAALEKLLEKYNDHTPAGVHLPALLRMTVRLLTSELVKDGVFHEDTFGQICKTFDGASTHAKASRRRPSNPSREQFNNGEIEWFSKNSYNLAIKYCAEVPPANLVRLLSACIEFIKILKDQDHAQDKSDDICLRLMFCHYLSVCTFTALARAEDSMQDCIQHYLQVSRHGREFRLLGADFIDKLRGSSKADMIAKHLQVVKLELEATLRREQWDELDSLFYECWKYGGPTHYDTLADLVLIMYSSMAKDNVDRKYQTKVLSALQKIINASGKGAGFDIVKMSRWIRCLFQLALTYDETVSLKCLDHAIRIASTRKGEPNHYPATELEWLATTAFNHAVDYYVQEKDDKCRLWAEKALTLAEWAEKGNGLRDALVEKYTGLTWDEGG